MRGSIIVFKRTNATSDQFGRELLTTSVSATPGVRTRCRQVWSQILSPTDPPWLCKVLSHGVYIVFRGVTTSRMLESANFRGVTTGKHSSISKKPLKTMVF